MAGEEKNTGQGEQITLDVPGASSVPDLTNGGPPAPELGDVEIGRAHV